jgi:hypothetical protein
MQRGCSQKGKHLGHMGLMFSLRLTEDKDIINIQDTELIKDRLKNPGHNRLKNGGGIGQPLPQHKALKMALWGTKSSLRDIRFQQGNLVVASHQVQRGEH